MTTESTKTVEIITSLQNHSALKAVQELFYKKDFKKEFDGAMGILTANGDTRLNNGLEKYRKAGIFQESELEDLLQISYRILDLKEFVANEYSRIKDLIVARQEVIRLENEALEKARLEREQQNAWIVNILVGHGAIFTDVVDGKIMFKVPVSAKGKESMKVMEKEFKATPTGVSEDYSFILAQFPAANLPSQEAA